MGTVDRAGSGGGVGRGLGDKEENWRRPSAFQKKLEAPLTRGAFTYIGANSGDAVETATAVVAMAVSSMPVGLEVVEDIRKKCVFASVALNL